MYKLFFRNEKDINKTIKRYPKKVKKQIKDAFKSLKENPISPNCVSCSRLKGYDCYKSKVGSYRIIYVVDNMKKQIEIVMIEDRKNIYKEIGV